MALETVIWFLKDEAVPLKEVRFVLFEPGHTRLTKRRCKIR